MYNVQDATALITTWYCTARTYTVLQVNKKSVSARRDVFVVVSTQQTRTTARWGNKNASEN